MNRLSLVRVVGAALLFLVVSCGVVTKDYTLDTTLLENGICEQGQFRCNADWLTTCNNTLTGFARALACDSAELCNSSAGRCDACRAGASRCNVAKLELCREDGSGWDLVEDCGSAEKCNVNLEACVACTPGEYQCNEGSLSQCSPQGGWGAAMACMQAERCQVTPDRKSGGCDTSPGCTPEAFSCNEAVLSRCDAQGVVVQVIETCASVALCQKALSAGSLHCAPPACKDSHACNGSTVQSCKTDRTGFEDTALVCTPPDSPCNPQLGNCSKCQEGTFFCQEANLLHCNAAGVFEVSQTCASAALCDAGTGSCKPPECEAEGMARCDPNLTLFRCSAGLTWEMKDTCDTFALCNAIDGRCEKAACPAAAIRCDHGNVQQCNNGQTAWAPLKDCASGTECDPVTADCQPAGCSEGTYRCNDVFLEKCASNTWMRLARCSSHNLCNATASSGECRPPECMPNQYKCEGADLFRCQPDGTWGDALLSCKDTTKCDPLAGTCK